MQTASGAAFRYTGCIFTGLKNWHRAMRMSRWKRTGALHSVSDINAGDDINIYLIDGHARAVVSEVINDEQRKCKKTLTLEERFAHLEQIVARMEDADVSLDEAI